MISVKRFVYVVGSAVLISSGSANAQGISAEANPQVLQPSAPKQIYQWIDEQGNTYYSDQPPQGTTPVRTLAPEQLSLSTIGDSALREGEQALLEHYREEAQARRDQAAERAPPTPIVVVNPPPEPVQKKSLVWLPRWGSAYQKPYRRHHGASWHLSLSAHWGQGRAHHTRPKPDDKLPSSIQPLKPSAPKSASRVAANPASARINNTLRPPLYPLVPR